MRVPVPKKPKPKEDPVHNCPNCKILLSNFLDLEVHILYECTNCNKNFFIVQSPRFYFT